MASDGGVARGSRWLRVLLAFVVVLLSRDARAEPSAADKETARSLLNTGDRKRDANDLRGALSAYVAADAIMGVPTTAIEVAKTEARLGMLVEARDSVLRVLRFPSVNGEPRAFQQARAAAERLAAELSPRIPSIQVKVHGAPLEEVTLEFDGEIVPKAAAWMARKVNPGQHNVVVWAEGYDRASDRVTIAERETREVDLTLTRSTELPAQAGSMSGAPGSDGSAPSPIAPTAMNVDQLHPSPTSPVVYVGASIAAVGLAIGSVSGITELVRTKEARDACNPGNQPDCSSLDDDAHRWATISNISLGVGALGAAVAIFALMKPKRSPSHATSEISLELKVTPGAAAIAGAF